MYASTYKAKWHKYMLINKGFLYGIHKKYDIETKVYKICNHKSLLFQFAQPKFSSEPTKLDINN